jgi:hypothetical protein
MPSASIDSGPAWPFDEGAPWPLFDLEDPETPPIGVIVENSIPRSGGWHVAATFLLHDDQLVLSELRVFPGSKAGPPGEWSRNTAALEGLPAGGITARMLREVNITDITARAHAWLRVLAEHVSDGPGARRSWSKTLSVEAAKPARAGRSDRYYAIWAARYVDKVGSTARPIEELAMEWDIKPAHVRDLIHKARERGLLTKGLPGRAGGALTDKGRKALNRGDVS